MNLNSDFDSLCIAMGMGHPEVVAPDPREYPGDVEWWRSGFDAYARGHPKSRADAPLDEARSWWHGFITARTADLIGAAVPQSYLPDLGAKEGPWADRFWGTSTEEEMEVEEESSSLSVAEQWDGAETEEEVAHDLCPFSDRSELREAWLDGFLARNGGLTFAADYGGPDDDRMDALRDGRRVRGLFERGEIGPPQVDAG
jgi:hypothetical protein